MALTAGGGPRAIRTLEPRHGGWVECVQVAEEGVLGTPAAKLEDTAAGHDCSVALARVWWGARHVGLDPIVAFHVQYQCVVELGEPLL